MHRTITAEETEKLFEFCNAHKVEYYDLQIELVDHLASAIEDSWKDNPELPFQNTLNECFGKFGIYGFTKIKKQKQKELKRKYTNLHKKFILKFYSWPKIIMTLSFTLVLFSVFKITNSIKVIYAIYFVFSILTIAYFYLFYSPHKLKLQTLKNQKFISLNYFKKVKNSVLIVAFLPLNIVNFFFLDAKKIDVPLSQIRWFNNIDNNWTLLVFSFIMVAFGISLYSSSFYIPEKMKQHFEQQFPEFIQQ